MWGPMRADVTVMVRELLSPDGVECSGDGTQLSAIAGALSR